MQEDATDDGDCANPHHPADLVRDTENAMRDDCPAERAAKADPKDERALGDEFRGLRVGHGPAVRTARRMRLDPRCPGAEGQGERREDRPDNVHRAPRTVSSDEYPR